MRFSEPGSSAGLDSYRTARVWDYHTLLLSARLYLLTVHMVISCAPAGPCRLEALVTSAQLAILLPTCVPVKCLIWQPCCHSLGRSGLIY